jgi:cytochrome P450
MKEGK